MTTQDYHAIAEIPVDTGEHDKLGLKAYSESLVKYITNSVTPTTIAIQGDWGSGKTSLLNIVQSKLDKEKYLCISFNTWQYSQFEMSESLAISFMTHFLSELKAAIGTSENVESALLTIRKVSLGIVKNMTVYTAGKIGGDEVKELVQGSIDSVESGFQGEDVIETLKTQIDDCIEELLGRNNLQKIIVFIDDLDRLNPVKAVELMEIIKIFMDKEGCVYVLAVDTEVVKQGIIQKYGLDEEKSQAFFDKLIQLPFSMPVSYYDFAGYVESIFPVEDGFDYCNDFLNRLEVEDREKCISLIQMVSARNPRAAKRAVNAFVLQDMVMQNKRVVSESGDSADEKERLATAKLLLALTCIQMKLEPDYGVILNMVEIFPEFLKWINNRDRIEIQDFELIQKYNYSEEQIKKYNRDKIACGKMLGIFKDWCRDYIRLHGDDGLALKNLLRATNGVAEEQGYDYAPIAKVILNEFEKRLKEYRKDVIWECMQEEKGAGTYELWYDEAVEIWDVSKKTQTYLSHQKMLDTITELTRSLRATGENAEAANRIMDFYNEIESTKFKYAYSKIVRENFKKIIGKNLTAHYDSLKRYEQDLEDALLVTDVFFRGSGFSDVNANRVMVHSFLQSWAQNKQKELFAENPILEGMFDEVWERVEYTISKQRSIKEGKAWGMSTDELSSLFSISVLLDDEETEEQFDLLKKAMNAMGKFSKEEEAYVRTYGYKTFWKDDIEERREIYRKLRWTFSWPQSEKVKEFLAWMKTEDDELGKYENGSVPEEYEKRRLQWYFQMVSFFVHCHVRKECTEDIQKCREIDNDALKCIFKAVDIAIEDYVSGAENDEKRNTSIFSGVTKEALEELQLAYSDTDGWLREKLTEDNKDLKLGMIKEFLMQPKDVLESVQGSYELGMLIGRCFDEDSKSQRYSAFVEDDDADKKCCCSEKREDTFLQKYYETFGKIINQLRLNNVDVLRLTKQDTDKYYGWYLLDSESEFTNDNLTMSKIQMTVLGVRRENRLDKDALSGEEARQLYDKIPWKAVKKRFAAESVYVGVDRTRDAAIRYFNTVGGLIYKDIPNFLSYLEKGDEVSDDFFMKSSQARHAKFMRKYYETLEFSKTLAES